MARIIPLFVFLAFLGCTNNDEEVSQELERQKLTLEMLERQQANLIALDEKGKELRDLERKHEEKLREIEKKNADLQKREKEQDEKLREIRERERNIQSLLEERKETLGKLREQNAQLEMKTELAKHRQPFLEDLVVKAAETLTLYAPKPSGSQDEVKVRDYWYNECLRFVFDSNVILIPSDEEFEAKATEVIERFYKRKCTSGGYLSLMRSRMEKSVKALFDEGKLEDAAKLIVVVYKGQHEKQYEEINEEDMLLLLKEAKKHNKDVKIILSRLRLYYGRGLEAVRQLILEDIHDN